MDEDAGDREGLERLREEIRAVRSSILDLLVQIDDLRLQQIPQAQADWQMAIGCWEQRLLEAELAGRRARRRLALLQAQANLGLPVDEQAVEAQLDEELAEWTRRVEEARKAYAAAMERVSSYAPLRRADSQELGRLYRTLMKRLHPDVCHVRGEEVESLFRSAQAAYARGDLRTLASLEVATRWLEGRDDLAGETDGEALAAELELAQVQEAATRHQLEELEGCEDLRRRDLLANPEWVSARTTELREGVRQWEAVVEECRRREAELGGCRDA